MNDKVEVRKNFKQASERTVEELRTIAHALDMRELSELNLPQIEAVADLVEKVTPAGDARNVIFSGRARVTQRHADPQSEKGWLKNLISDKAVYNAFFAGPATILWGYQRLMQRWGKKPEDAFPEGYWQFYIDYALREDTARHANETHGFDTVLKRHNIKLSHIDRITAWVMAGIYCLHTYDNLLHNEWRERVYTSTLKNITKNHPDYNRFARLYRQWERQRPYRRGPDVLPSQDYVAYRRQKFDEFLEKGMLNLPQNLRQAWVYAVRRAKKEELPRYQKQMSILAHLHSNEYGEERIPIDLTEAHIGVVYHGRYYFIPICAPNTRQPTDIMTIRSQVAALIRDSTNNNTPPINLTTWARTKRSHIPILRQNMRPELLQQLKIFAHTPILLNVDQRPYFEELSQLRQTERGLGTHAMTIFNTGESFVFDQSHIFFDGTWGAAMAEIVTSEATAWGVYLNTLPAISQPITPPQRLNLSFNDTEKKHLANAPLVISEASAETEDVNLRNLLALRRIFKLRNDLIQLTVNDLLVLYRAIHAFTYRPDPRLVATLESLLSHEDEATQTAAQATLNILDATQATNPAILIPVDASQQNPRDRLHPMTFQVPIHELHLLERHEQVMAALNYYKMSHHGRDEAYQRFDELQRTYLAALAGCGTVFSRAKEIAAMGESPSIGTIKLLAHLPIPLQRLLDKIPSRFDVLNDLIKGREVFSNIGAVASTSSLLRFMSAKDDNDNKTLAWGVLTDAENLMRITLRDFRPHVQALTSLGKLDLATKVTQDYLTAYANGLNDYVKDLRRITMASRETRLTSDLGLSDE